MAAEPLTLVHTMGRVGSTSVFRALESSGIEALHIHHLDPRALHERIPTGGIAAAARHIRDGFRALEAMQEDRPVQVLTLVREPIGRNISVAFTRFRREGEPHELPVLLGDQDLLSRIWRGKNYRMPYWWFDSEFRDALGVDPYAREFGETLRATGSASCSQGRVRALVLHSDLPNEKKSTVVSQFLDTEIAVGYNVSATRPGGRLYEIYEDFIAASPVTRSELEEAASSLYFRHFFGRPREAYVEEWAARLQAR